MSRKLTQAEKTDIEVLIDHCGLAAVISAVAEACREKEAHVQDTWQDKELAKQWSKAAQAVERCSVSSAVVDAPL